MVGSSMCSFLNARLQQIMETKDLFGGISLIGDLYQLKPVFDEWIFESSAISHNVLGLVAQCLHSQTAAELNHFKRQCESRCQAYKGYH